MIDNSTGRTYNENDLFIDSSGRIVRGNKAFLNSDKFNVTIQPTFESEKNDFNKSVLKKKKFKRINEGTQDELFDSGSDDEVKGIFVTTSLPRLLSENNFKTLSVLEQKLALKQLEKLLAVNGIKTNINNATLSRVDTFTNIKTDNIFFAYSNLFSLMECSRMKSVGWGDESFLWKNGNQQIMIYDKVQEMRQKFPETKFRNKRNIMRFENRLLKKRSIENKLHLVTVDDIYKNYDQVKEFHKNEINKRIFKYSIDDIETLTENDLRKKFHISKKLYGKRWFYQYCFTLGVWSISKLADDNFISEVISELDEGSESQLRVKKHRIKKAMQEAKFNFAPGGIFHDDHITFKSNIELYNEIKNKFYKEVA